MTTANFMDDSIFFEIYWKQARNAEVSRRRQNNKKKHIKTTAANLKALKNNNNNNKIIMINEKGVIWGTPPLGGQTRIF